MAAPPMLFNPNADKKGLYHILEVSPDASQADIKKAYYKASLKYHPDKNTGMDAKVKYARIQTAYTTLSDPNKKLVYDHYGEEGVNAFEQYIGLEKAPELIPIFELVFSPLFAPFLFCLTLVFIGLIVSFPIAVADKVDGGRPTSWAVIFVPLWIVHAFLVVGLCLAQKSKAMVSVYIRVALFLLFEILLVLRLSSGGLGSYWWVFIPLIAFELVGLASRAPSLSPHAYAVKKELEKMFIEGRVLEDDEQSESAQIVQDYGFGYGGFLVYNTLSVLTRLFTIVLVALRLNGNFGGNFFVPLLPSIIYYCLEAFPLAVLQARSTLRKEMDQLMRMLAQGADMEEIAEETQQRRTASGGNVCVALYAFGTMVTFLCLVASKASYDSMTLAVVFIPVFVCIGCLCCVLCCLDCVIISSRPMGEAEVGNSDNTYHDYVDEESPNDPSPPPNHNGSGSGSGSGGGVAANEGGGTHKTPLTGGSQSGASGTGASSATGGAYGATGQRASMDGGYHGGGAKGSYADVD